MSNDSKGIYLVGGFGKNRLILDTVDYLCLETLKLTSLPPLPIQMYSPAVCCFRGQLFVIKSQIFVYDTTLKLWSKIDNVTLPKHMEFNRALVHENYIYLTGNHAYELYRLNPDDINRNRDENVRIADESLPDISQKPPVQPSKAEDKPALEFLGKFANEAQNVCVVANTIYNFSTDQFEYNSVIETYNLETRKFNVVWEKETHQFDFSPYYSSGCFPLIIY